MEETLSSWFAVERKLVEDLPAVHLQVLIELTKRARYNGNRADPDTKRQMEFGEFYFGTAKLAKKIQRSVKQVRLAVKDLEKWGKLRAIKGHTKGTTGFIGDFRWIGASKGQTEGKQRATKLQVPVQEQRKEEEVSASPQRQLSLFIETLNKLTGGSFRSNTVTTVSAFNARTKEFAPTDAELVALLNAKAKQWLGDPKMEGNLCPTTLLRPANFERYLNEGRALLKSEALVSEAYGV